MLPVGDARAEDGFIARRDVSYASSNGRYADVSTINKVHEKNNQIINQEKFPFKCDKCGCTDYKKGESLSVGGFLSKILNIQTRRFVTISCEKCGHTEFYERFQNPIANIIDIFIR
ncbi:nucleic-acid-binding protein with Zn-ribbon domain [Acrasis kona]|uniref:Nucleic-acid-binding protein with Zn-ribbon domain n=1 Tax=Acrasis kona TaxID=1008807 RepID=A0AAW2ZK64_9EUKA